MTSNRYLVRFYARKCGALGVAQVYSVQVDATSPEHAWELARPKATELDLEVMAPMMGPLYTAKPTFRHWVYGSGMCGCLFDSGPHVAETLSEAIEGALCIFEELPEVELEQARSDLGTNFIHYFSDPSEAGAQYVQVMGCDCENHTEHDDE